MWVHEILRPTVFPLHILVYAEQLYLKIMINNDYKKNSSLKFKNSYLSQQFNLLRKYRM
jgi:hypothetical protein